MRSTSAHQWRRLMPLLLILICFSSRVSISSATQFYRIPRLGRIFRQDDGHGLRPTHSTPPSSSEETQDYFYNQTLDHFNYNPSSYAKFKQYYVIKYKHWGGANSSSPIFAFLGDEAALNVSADFLSDNAPRFKALLVYIEHRFYGRSNPLGSMDKALANKDIRGYFNSAQALADYAEILLHVKEKLSAHYSPIIVFGGSYGGMLASWFRLKYPHIAVGAFASSAPILYFDDITPQNGYYSKVTEDFKEASENCYQTVRDSWSMIDKVASQSNGLTVLSQKFKTCVPLISSSELKDFLESVYTRAAQYNSPRRLYPVTRFCGGVDKSPKGAVVLDRIFAGLVSLKGNLSCFDTSMHSTPSETQEGWHWQRCSEMVMPIGRGSNDTMFPAFPFILKDFIESCNTSYGVTPRPHWITTYYGGHDIKLILKRFGSNIIFSNGLRDPYSTGGVLENLSESIIAVSTQNGSHCLDINAADKSDPGWLVAQRKIEVEIIGGWLKTYYADLANINKRNS